MDLYDTLEKEPQKDGPEAGTFSGFGIKPAPLCKGAYVVAGDGFEAYKKFAEDMDAYEIKTSKKPAVKYVDPATIEDIRLSEHDIEDPESFWGQHKRFGTMDSFVRIAEHIPEVREKLYGGATLGQVKQDEQLRECAEIYFDMGNVNALSAYEGPGFLWFQTNGRHRALAARAAGHQIPVKILGRIIPKGAG